MDNNTFIPQAFIDKMATILPEHLHLDDLISACRRPLRKAVRVNTLKVSIENFKIKAAQHGWILTPIPWCIEGFWIETSIENSTNPQSLGNSAEHLAGLCYIQEASSMMPVSALFHFIKPSKELTLLDAASAPGSKTTQMAAVMNNQGLIIANEYSSSRIKMLHANIQRCGIKNVALTHFDAAVFGAWLPETFDAILLDAPCSGEGTVRKDKHAMKNWNQSAIEDISAMQKNLMESAFQALKPGGVMVYSTCTLSLEENQHVCEYIKQTYPENVTFLSLAGLFEEAGQTITQEGFLHIWPQVYDTEGFFVAAIRKDGNVDSSKADKRLGKFPFQRAKEVTQKNLYQYFFQQFMITDIEGVLYQRDDEFWLFPDNIVPLINELRFSRLGIKIAEQFGKGRKSGFKTTHEFARCFAAQSQRNNIELNKEQANAFYQGRDIHDIDCGKASGEIFVHYCGDNIGLGKALVGRIKNNLPRELIHDKPVFI